MASRKHKTYLVEHHQWVPSRREEVFAFFSDARNLEELTPPWLRFSILTPGPISIARGSTIRYQLHWHGLPLNWNTEITRWDPPHSFEDVQLSGPYRLWRHMHRFEPVADGTFMTDIVRYALPFGFVGRAMHRLVVRRNIEEIFEYRFDRIQTLFGGDRVAKPAKL